MKQRSGWRGVGQVRDCAVLFPEHLLVVGRHFPITFLSQLECRFKANPDSM